MRRHGLHTVFGLAWIGFVWWLDPRFLPWLMPVVGALVVSIPLSVYTSRADAGKALRRLGLFLIPEETRPPPVLVATQKYLGEGSGAAMPNGSTDVLRRPRRPIVARAPGIPARAVGD